MAELSLPKTMGCIVRTAGLQRTKTEIKRDFDYLARLWDEIRETTLTVVRAGRDLWRQRPDQARDPRHLQSRDRRDARRGRGRLSRQARSFMKLLMPGHAKKIVPYVDAVPLFQRFGVEEQLSAMYQPLVQLKSGGYLVINPTEALVSIDINSGRSTREHNIEQTALIDQSRGGARDRPPAAPARHGRAGRDRLHRHGEQLEQPEGREGDEGGAAQRSRAHPGRPHLVVRPVRDEPPAHPHRRARSLDPAVPALRRHRAGPHRLVGRPLGAAHARGRGRARPRQPAVPARQHRRRPSTCSTASAPSWPRSRIATAC